MKNIYYNNVRFIGLEIFEDAKMLKLNNLKFLAIEFRFVLSPRGVVALCIKLFLFEF